MFVFHPLEKMLGSLRYKTVELKFETVRRQIIILQNNKRERFF